MRLLLPLRSSVIALTGSGLSIRAISAISSGGWEERITHFVPRGILFKSTLRIAAEENLAAGRRHFAVYKHFGKIVDKDVASKLAYSPHLVIPRTLEVNVAPLEAEARHIEELLAFHPAQRRHPQVGLRVIVRALRLVAHDGDGVGVVSARLEEFRHAVEEHRCIDSPSINEALQRLPQVAIGPLDQQGALDRSLVACERRRQNSLFLADPQESLIVADQRVVEIETDPHRVTLHQPPLRRCPTLRLPAENGRRAWRGHPGRLARAYPASARSCGSKGSHDDAGRSQAPGRRSAPRRSPGPAAVAASRQ